MPSQMMESDTLLATQPPHMQDLKVLGAIAIESPYL